MLKNIQILTFLVILFPLLNSCGTGVDARQFPPEPEKRVKKNIEEGRGFTMMGAVNNKGNSGTFDFASSNELWRASLDTIDFMPLVSANYSGGIIITDWYSSGSNTNESIKISIRFLTNEVRSDALDIKIFYKNCGQNDNCQISEKKGSLVAELNKKILSKAAVYEKESKDKSKKKYVGKQGAGKQKKKKKKK
tara:strand:+ start:171 stop:749 length:579 start_codon:yes stop_codon:yes gene_type:complete